MSASARSNFRIRKEEAAVPRKESWEGRFFEDFAEGDVFTHPCGRTITETENTWFTHITLNTNQVHFNRHYAENTEFGRPLVNSTLTLAMVTGMGVTNVSHNAFANLGWDNVRLPNPLFVGDTLYARSEVTKLRDSESRPAVGIVTVHTQGYKEDGTVVIEYDRTVMVYRRGASPREDPPAPRPEDSA